MKAIFYANTRFAFDFFSEIFSEYSPNFKYTKDIDILESEIINFRPDFIFLHAHTLHWPIGNPYLPDFQRIKLLTKQIRKLIPSCTIVVTHNPSPSYRFSSVLKEEYEHDFIISVDNIPRYIADDILLKMDVPLFRKHVEKTNNEITLVYSLEGMDISLDKEWKSTTLLILRLLKEREKLLAYAFHTDYSEYDHEFINEKVKDDNLYTLVYGLERRASNREGGLCSDWERLRSYLHSMRAAMEMKLDYIIELSDGDVSYLLGMLKIGIPGIRQFIFDFDILCSAL